MAKRRKREETRTEAEGPDADDVRVVLDFAAAWKTRDLERVMSFLDDDAIWENVPIEVIAGKAAIRRKLAAVFGAVTGFEWIVIDAARSPSGAVLTERLDVVIVNGRRVKLRLMGIFRVVDGKIALWRDYFDLQQYVGQLGAKPW